MDYQIDTDAISDNMSFCENREFVFKDNWINY